MDFPTTADVAVIGGGIIGVSVAYHLARMGAGRVVLFERKHLAAGATGMSSGLVRMHYDNPIEATFAQRSFPFFQHFDELIGGDCGFVRTGFVRIAKHRNLDRLQANVAMLQELGIDTRLVTGDDVKAMAPYMVTDDFPLAAYEPHSGYADPHRTTLGLAKAAQRHGARILQGVEVTGIDVLGGRVQGVGCSQGKVATGVVVNAAGPWGARVAAMAGLRLEIAPALHQATVLETPPQLPAPHLTFIDRINGVYGRSETGNLTLAGISGGESRQLLETDGLDSAGYAPTPQAQFQTLERLCARIPSMEASPVHRGHVGVEGYTPDGHALLGPVPDVQGFYLATGMSGHGFKEGPAIGQALAELVLHGQTEMVDIAPLRATRFAEGQPYQGPNAYQ